MADKPIYYGAQRAPMYYGGKKPMYYGAGGSSYGRSPYGSYGAYGGSYGVYGDSSSGSRDSEDFSIIGTVTVSRMLRVISQRWLSVFVCLLIGLIVAFAIYRISPTIYEARSEFTMDMRRSTRGVGQGLLADSTPDLGNSYAEIFNTRISDWRSDAVVTKIIQIYRAGHPTSTVTDEEIIGVLSGSILELVRNSRIITISLRSKSPALCAALANAYAEAIEAFTDEENKARCDKAVSQIHGNVEKQRRTTDKIAKQIVDFRTANKVDNLRSTRDMIQQGLSKATTDILALETQETQLGEWEKMLEAVQKDPSTYGNLSTGVPRAQEIAEEFRAYQDAEGECRKLEFAFTENHPEVISARNALELAKKRFLDAAARALLTGRSTLSVNRNQLAKLRQKQEDLRNELSSIEQRIVLAESGLSQLETEYNVAAEVHKGLQLEENSARIAAESNNEIVRVGRPAVVPRNPVLPNPLIIFGVGIFLSLTLGVLFVLIVDNLEDTVVNLADIEGRLSLKVLSVFPHVRRKNRKDVARFMLEDKYSQFSESVAALRNLLDSPRYEALSHCLLLISTQPGEGKTISSTSLAIAYAQSGRKTLHVDFDMRRPRLAKIWEVDIDKEHSLSHVLQSAGRNVPDFQSLVHPSSVPGLDVIVSAPPEGVSPATIFGSSVIPDFFDWARTAYDHIIIDSPPYGLVGDVVSLSVMVDSVIIMCCPNRTHFKPIQYCSRSLTEAGANILGVIINDIEMGSSNAFSPHSTSRGGYYKYGYGYGYGYAPSAKDDEDESSVRKPVSKEANGEKTDGHVDVGSIPEGFADDE